MSGDAIAQVAARYDFLAHAYDRIWSPVIRPMALRIFGAADISDAQTVLDVGCGSGALAADLAGAAPKARIIGVDRSPGMLSVARALLPVALGDATRLPVAAGAVDAATCFFMLQHMPQPADAIRAMAECLRPGGRLLTVTWGADATLKSEETCHAALDAAGAPPCAPVIANHDLVDSIDKVGEMAGQAGLSIEAAWAERCVHEWTPQTLWASLAEYGRGLQRLNGVDPDARAAAAETARAAVEKLGDAALRWDPQIVYLIARS